jgi:hypothetical protein
MTTLPRLQIRDREHPRRTILRIAFWLLLLVLLCMLAASALHDPRSRTPRQATSTPTTELTKSPATATVHPVIRPTRPVAAKPTPKPSTTKPGRSQGARPAGTGSSGRGSASTPRAPSTPRPPSTTPRPDPIVPVPTPTPPAPNPTTTDPTPPPSSTGAGGAEGAPDPIAPRPPSNHNCDPTNQTC